MTIIHATQDNFTENATKGLVLVDFWAPWCGPCKMIAPVLDELASDVPDVQIVKVDIDEQQALAGRFGIMSIPTLLVLKDGQPVDQMVGYQPKEAILDRINQHR